MNVWDILITVLISAAVVAAVAIIIRNKKRGRGCCGDCAKCGGCVYKEN